MKKVIAFWLVIVMLFSFSGCGEGISDVNDYDDANDNESSLNVDSSFDDTDEDEFPEKTELLAFDDVEVSYVMVYNPKIYDEENKYVSTNLNSGSLSSYIDVDVNRGSGLEGKKNPFSPFSQGELNAGLDLSDIEIGLNRGDTIITPYKVGDIHEFYTVNQYSLEEREKTEFICRYAGKYCNIWSVDKNISDSNISHCGKEFDNTIYEKTVGLFGESRFANNGGKVNILMYPFQYNLLGFFHTYDIFASGEVSNYMISQYGLNTDHDIININAYYAEGELYLDQVTSTLAHEYQHLICMTSSMCTTDQVMMNTWINEAMSGYVEEYIYPGIQKEAQRYESLEESDLIRYGQSLYNFDTTNEDIGVYGSVFLFSEYLNNVAGEGCFKNLHTYWRDSYSSTLCVSEAIYNSVPEAYRKKIDKSISYTDNINFANDYDEWMSKMTLDFYISMLAYDSGDPAAYSDVNSSYLLYDSISDADIEGGGRIIFATKDGKFEIPDDADEGLVYVGFNSDFEVVTDYIVK